MKEPVHYHYALLDKAGKTRGTCTATSVSQARQVLLRARRGAKFPPGYYMVRRGPVEPPASCPSDPAPIQATHPFQVGDLVKGKGWISGMEHTGHIIALTESMVQIKKDESGHNPHLTLNSVTLLEPAPEPKNSALDPQAKELLEHAHASLKAANTENQELRRKLDVTDEILVKTLDGRDYLRARVDELRQERHYLKERVDALDRVTARMTEANRDRIKREAEEIVTTVLASQAAHIERQLEALLDDRRAAGIPQLPIDHAPMSVAVDILRLLAQEYCPTNPKPKGEKA